MLHVTNGGLPYLAPALGRLLEEYPGAPDGLARTERQLLAAIDGGAADFTAAFVAAQEAEEAPFLGDLTAFERLEELASAAEPLVAGRLEPPEDAPGARSGRFTPARGPLSLTDAGRALLAGERIGSSSWASTGGSAECTCAPARASGGGTTRGASS